MKHPKRRKTSKMAEPQIEVKVGVHWKDLMFILANNYFYRERSFTFIQNKKS